MFDVKAWKKTWREKNRDKIRVYGYEYSQKNPQKILLLSAKHRSIKKGVVCTIKEEDIHIPTICPVLGITIEKVFNPDGKLSIFFNKLSLHISLNRLGGKLSKLVILLLSQNNSCKLHGK